MAKRNSTGSEIRYHDEKCPLHRLPFFSPAPKRKRFNSEARSWGQTSYWGISPGANYIDGCSVGKVAAWAYLKMLRETGDGYALGLQHIVFDMARRQVLGDGGSNESALRGNIVGFFSELDRWLSLAVKLAGESLEQMSETEICERLKAEIHGGTTRKYEEFARAKRSEAAKRGARTRAARRAAKADERFQQFLEKTTSKGA